MGKTYTIDTSTLATSGTTLTTSASPSYSFDTSDDFDLSSVYQDVNTDITLSVDGEERKISELFKTVDVIKKRMAILEPKKEMLEKYKVLQDLYDQYKAPEALLDGPMWRITMKTINYDWSKVEKGIQHIAMQMYESEWRPDYIVGITRGGLVPAVMLSHMTNIPMHTLSIQLGAEGLEENTESNCWMAEDAFGYKDNQKNILVIDDINRGGDATAWLMNDWKAGCLPNDTLTWESVGIIMLSLPHLLWTQIPS